MEQIKKLYLHWISGDETPEEGAELSRLLDDASAETDLLQAMEQPWAMVPDDTAFDQERRQLLAQRILERYPHAGEPDEVLLTESGAVSSAPLRVVHFLKTGWLRYAAVLLLIAGAAIYLFTGTPSSKKAAGTPPVLSGVQPGVNKAILTLADGSTILLDSAADGQLARQGNTRVLKLKSGSLAYQQGDTGGEMVYNTLSIPRGGQYHLRLPDGTGVWLNAASSLRFPVSFSAGERTVEVSGEAYFEVTEDKRRPFYVRSAHTKIQVLGTSFNVNANEDEVSEKTTLLTGSIKISRANTTVLLLPGQQAIAKDDIRVINNADTEQALAWKNGLFNFQDKDLREVMRQLSRWYNIDVVYEKGVKDIYFVGEMTRNENLEFVLKTLQKFGVHFRMEEGKRLVVMP